MCVGDGLFLCGVNSRILISAKCSYLDISGVIRFMFMIEASSLYVFIFVGKALELQGKKKKQIKTFVGGVFLGVYGTWRAEERSKNENKQESNKKG